MGRSMKTERAILQFARRKLSVQQIAARLKIHPRSVINTGRTLGIYFTALERKLAARQRAKQA
jgi:DNA-binding CsgD family transcriptional regulator